MNSELVVPQTIEEVIRVHDTVNGSFRELELKAELTAARSKLEKPSQAENLGAWAEILAFALTPSRTGASPWRTYFGPMGSGTDNEGKTVYFPDIADTEPVVVEHWKERARTVVNPILRSRYADLVWDMAVPLGKQRRDKDFAEIAVDTYLQSATGEFRPELGDQLRAAIRALELSILIQDSARTDRCRQRMLQIHREALSKKHRIWWMTFDKLIADKNSGLTEPERDELVAGLEGLLLHFADTSKPDAFDPHGVQNVAKRLIRHYSRSDQSDERRQTPRSHSSCV